MRTTTESVPDVASRVDSVPAHSLTASTPTENHSIPELIGGIDPNCPCVPCLAACDRLADAGGIPTNGSWWKIQRDFVRDHVLYPLSRICDACGSVKNPDGNCSLVTCRKHDANGLCPQCGGAREVRREVMAGFEQRPCRHPFHGDISLEEVSEVVAGGDAAAEPGAGEAEESSPAAKAELVAQAIREQGLPIALGGGEGYGEPWHVRDDKWSGVNLCNVLGLRVLLIDDSDIPRRSRYSYLRRIAACVNACIGIPTAVLEQNIVPFASTSSPEHQSTLVELAHNSRQFHADQAGR